MAYYITEDGRVVPFDADVKEDGTVRPANYSQFILGQPTSANVKEQKYTTYPLTRPVPKTQQNSTILPKSTKRQKSAAQQKSATPLKSTKKPKKTIPQVSAKQVKRTKQQKDELRAKISKIIQDSHLSKSAQELIMLKAGCLQEIVINNKLIKAINNRSLDYEKDKIQNAILQINALLHETKPVQKHIPVATTSTTKTQPTASKKVTVVQSDEVRTKFNYWTSGNYVRKGPAPKYGYARDRFGRVQERDSYREDKDVNPYSIDSSYDSEDDHASMDILD